MARTLNEQFDDDEFLYRGIVEQNWDSEHNRPSSATFKDSKGTSVDRDGGRLEEECINTLKKVRNFKGICKVKVAHVKYAGGIVKYLPLKNNIFHSEIHDSENRAQLKGRKPKAIRDKSLMVYERRN